MSVLEELYNGNICPADKFAKKNGEYQRLIVRFTECVEKFLPMLDEAGLELWNEIMDIDCRMECISDKESFIDGFCLGAQLVHEITETDRISREVL